MNHIVSKPLITTIIPIVSIGMPVYNEKKYIRRALDFLLAQDYENFELIISDNASTDATLQICREYADKDRRIKVYAQSRNIGIIGNFKTVLKMARGKYFMWAAADDCWLPGFVKALIDELEIHPEAGAAMCAVDIVWENGDPFEKIRFINKDNPNYRSYYQMLKSLTSPKRYNLYIYGLFRNQLLRQAITFPEVPAADRLFICQLALATRFRYIDQVFHIRIVRSQPENVRRPNEKFIKMLDEDKWSDVKRLFALWQIIYKSPIIPFYRKIYLPIAIWRYGWLLVIASIKIKVIGGIIKKVKERVTPETWKRLKKFKKLILLK